MKQPTNTNQQENQSKEFTPPTNSEKLLHHATNITESYEKMLDSYIELREVFEFEKCLGEQIDECFTQIWGFIKGIEFAANIISNTNI